MITAMWRPEFASLHKDVDAQKVADEILGIGEEVTAEEVVNAARDESCELHKCFEWDNSIAAFDYSQRDRRNERSTADSVDVQQRRQYIQISAAGFQQAR